MIMGIVLFGKVFIAVESIILVQFLMYATLKYIYGW